MSTDRRSRLQGGIRRKITWMLCIFGVLSVVSVTGVAMRYVYRMRMETLIDRQDATAYVIAESLSNMLDQAVLELQGHAASPVWQDAARDSNTRYALMPEQEIASHMAEMDVQWIPAPADSALVGEYLSRPLSRSLKSLRAARKNIAEIFVTDRYGAIVAASNKTSDFYQADEEWWQRAYAGGKGRVFVGGIALDESTGIMAVTIAGPFFDEDGRVIGICKELLDAGNYFSVLGSYVLGKTGHAMLVDSDGTVLWDKHALSCGPAAHNKASMKMAISGQAVITGGADCTEERPGCSSITSAKKVPISAGISKDFDWYVVVAMCQHDAFLPLIGIVKKTMAMVGLVLSGLLIAGLIVGQRLTRPLQMLNAAVVEVMRGNRSSLPALKTGDEIEQFSDTFGLLLAQNAQKQSALEEAKESLERAGVDLEKRIEERTAELTRSQAAVMNILDDLMVSKKDLQEREERYRMLFEAAGDPIFVHDTEGHILMANEAALTQYGYTKAELLTMTVGMLDSPEDKPHMRKRIDALIAKGMTSFETGHIRKDGSRVNVDVKARRIDWVGTQAMMSICRDVTARKSYDKQQRLSQLGKLVSEMAHEVNNPLMIISGNAQVALLDTAEDSALKENLTIITEECTRAKNIISRLLSFAKPGIGRRESVDIHTTVESVLALLEKDLLLRGIIVNKDYARDLPRVLVDEKQMQEVIMNLLTNAREAIPGAGVIDISTSFNGEQVFLAIKDTGTGISNDAMGRLFEPFFTTKEKGTGLGLPICFGIVKAHGGDILAETDPGHGTIFTVRLPAERAHHA